MQNSALELTLVIHKGATHIGVKTTKVTPVTKGKHEDDTVSSIYWVN